MLTADEARDLTESIRRDLNAFVAKIIRAYEGQAHTALGYGSWATYCSAEFDTEHFALPRSERPAIVAVLRDIGMSTREIGATVNESQSTVARQLRESNDSCEPEVKPERAAPPRRDAPKPAAEPDDDDVEFTKSLIDRIARDIYRFAGMYDPETCVRLRDQLEPSLQRLDKRIQAGGR